MTDAALLGALPAIDRDVQLLLETAMRPLGEAARSWALWKQRNNLDDVGWEQHRTLALIAPRLPEIDPDGDYLPRVKGLAKASWTQSQLQLQASTEAVGILAAAGIPVLFIKGGAFLAAGYRFAVPRISADLDILVPRARFGDAVRVLYRSGWRAAHSVEYASNHWRFQPGLNLLRGRHGDIDVHHQPVRSPRLDDGVLESIWRRARPATFRGQSILVPSVADMVVFTAAHAIPDAAEVSTAAWALDLQLLLNQPDFDPEATASVAVELGASASCVAAMRLLRNLAEFEPAKLLLEALHDNRDAGRPLAPASLPPGRWTVPVRRALRPLVSRAGVPSTRALLALYAGTPGSRISRPFRRLAGRVATKAERDFESEDEAIPYLIEQRRHPGRTRDIPLSPPLRQPALRHEFTPDGRAKNDRFLIIDVEFERPPVDRRCRLEIISGGLPVAQPVLWRRPGTPPKATACFALPLRLLPAGSVELAVESEAEEIFHGTPPDSVIFRTEAIPYGITRLAWC
ncbi:MAG: nucleotidyltransferase family protein [Bauldia sp.]|nr:nucleotidyltransferase family protein [Bauldia sp.]